VSGIVASVEADDTDLVEQGQVLIVRSGQRNLGHDGGCRAGCRAHTRRLDHGQYQLVMDLLHKFAGWPGGGFHLKRRHIKVDGRKKCHRQSADEKCK